MLPKRLSEKGFGVLQKASVHANLGAAELQVLLDERNGELVEWERGLLL